MRSTAKSSWELTGWQKATRSSLRWATSWRSSRRTTAKVEAVNPCLRAFWAERVLPSGVRGPVDLAALARLAANCSGETTFCELSIVMLLSIPGWHGARGSLKLRRGYVAGGKEVRSGKVSVIGEVAGRRAARVRDER